jgi:transposase
VHFDTTSRSVWGDYQFAETQDLPFQVTYGYSKDKRPDLKQCVLSTLCVDRAVPMWGKPEDGKASDKTLNATLWSEITQRLACYGVQPGAYIYIADAALVTADNLAALRDTFFIHHPPPRHLERMWPGHCGGRRPQPLGGDGCAGPDAPDEAPAGDLL